MDYVKNKIIIIDYLNNSNENEQFKIKVNKSELQKLKIDKSENLVCDIQRFEKMLNNSEAGFCSWCSIQIFDEKKRLNHNYECFLNKTGYFYLNSQIEQNMNTFF